MLDIIIIVAVAVVAFSFIRNLSSKDRKVFFKTSLNVATSATTYGLKTAKESIKGLNDIGAIGAATISIEGQEVIIAANDYNKDIASKGGAVKATIKANIAHGDYLGTTDMLRSIHNKRKSVEAELAILSKTI